MKETMIGSARFGIGMPPEAAVAAGAPIMLSFEVLLELTPGLAPVPIERIVIPFTAEAWENFKRAVAAGKASSIAIARPNGRMDIPR